MKKQTFIAIGLLTAFFSSPAVQAEEEPIVLVPMVAKQASYVLKPPPMTLAATQAVAEFRIIDFQQCMADRGDLQTQVQDLQDQIERLCEERCSRDRRHESCMNACRED